MANINAQEFQDIQILLPPKSLQEKYKAIVQETKKRTGQLKESLALEGNLFAGLSQCECAFAGEL